MRRSFLPRPIKEMDRFDVGVIALVAVVFCGIMALNVFYWRAKTPNAPWWTWLLP